MDDTREYLSFDINQIIDVFVKSLPGNIQKYNHYQKEDKILIEILSKGENNDRT